MKYLLCLFLAVVAPILKAELPPPVLYSEEPYFTEIQGITLSSYPPTERELAEKYTGIHFLNLDIPGEPSMLRKRLVPYLNNPLSADEVDSIVAVVKNYYDEKGYPGTIVELIDEDPEDGLLWIIVTQKK